MRTIGSLLAVIALLVAPRLPDPWIAAGLRYVALGYMFGDFLLRVRAGYLRRKPHWTAESWRRYLLACSVPLAALVIMVGLMFALEWRLAFVGEPRSAVRMVLVIVVVTLLLIGAGGLAVAVDKMTSGEASRQFTLPTWLTRRRGAA